MLVGMSQEAAAAVTIQGSGSVCFLLKPCQNSAQHYINAHLTCGAHNTLLWFANVLTVLQKGWPPLGYRNDTITIVAVYHFFLFCLQSALCNFYLFQILSSLWVGALLLGIQQEYTFGKQRTLQSHNGLLNTKGPSSHLFCREFIMICVHSVIGGIICIALNTVYTCKNVGVVLLLLFQSVHIL